jgi:hypothetical protein
MKKLLKIKKGCDIQKNLTDSYSADQGLYSDKKNIKIPAKTRIQGYKNIEKHAYIGSQSKF